MDEKGKMKYLSIGTLLLMSSCYLKERPEITREYKAHYDTEKGKIKKVEEARLSMEWKIKHDDDN